jgi:hypothetical protein
MKETFTHGRILYTLFDSFVNPILATLHIAVSSVVSNVGRDGYFVAQLRE